MGLFKKAKKERVAGKFSFWSTAEEVAEGIDASNLTAIVTGGNGGIGAETVQVLAKHGAAVVIAARKIQSAESLKAAILEELPEAKLFCMTLDLASLESVRRFAEEFLSTGMPLNLLINNAGVMFIPYGKSVDGVELQFATNHLGHFLLTELLVEKMKASAAESGIEGRIVNLSSVAHSNLGYKEGILDVESISDEKLYDLKHAYGQSKLANVLHANMLAEKLRDSNVTANSVHPGLINTGLWKHSSSMKFIVKTLSVIGLATKWKDVKQGAATTVYVAIHPDNNGVSGKYFEDCRVSQASRKGQDPELAKKLWGISEKLVN